MHDSKPFEATPGRIARAKREGDVPRSAELSAAFTLGGGSVALCSVWGLASEAAATAIRDASRATPNLWPYAVLAACAVGPCLSAYLCATLASAVMAGGFALRAPRFELGKLAPGHGLKRMFSLRTMAFAARAFLTACAAGAALFPAVRDAASPLSGADSAQAFARTAIGTVERVLFTATALGLAFGVGDALLERQTWRRRLRMSLDELKRDLKQSEGDPALRSRRRTQHRTLLRGSLSRLPEATFVVANPSHVAVALEYRPPQVAVPRVLIRAVEAGAQLVETQARALGIPIVEDVHLARTLLATTHVDETIPRACYMAVARIVAALLQERPAR